MEDWNMNQKAMAEEIGVNTHSFRGWLVHDIAPTPYFIDTIKDYFEGEPGFDKVKFITPVKYKVVRSDGTEKYYNTLNEISFKEGVSKNTVSLYTALNRSVKSGKNKGYRFELIKEEN